MIDGITLVIYTAEGEAISVAKTYSVRDYAMDTLAVTTKDDYKTALVDMLNYGAAAQTSFEYKTGDLANKLLTTEQKAYATTTMAACVNNRVVTNADYYFASNVRFEGKTNLLIAFANISNFSEDTYTVITWTDHKGNDHTVTVEGKDYSTSGSKRVVELDQLVAADARQQITFTLYNSDGTVLTSVTDSIEANVARASAAKKDLYESYMKFADSVYEYLH